MPMSILGYVPELIIAICAIFFVRAIALGASSMPTKLGIATSVIVEIALGGDRGFTKSRACLCPRRGNPDK